MNNNQTNITQTNSINNWINDTNKSTPYGPYDKTSHIIKNKTTSIQIIQHLYTPNINDYTSNIINDNIHHDTIRIHLVI